MKYIVTGSSSGLGKTICQNLLDEGHHVIGIARRDCDFNQHPYYQHLNCDLSNETEVENLLTKIESMQDINGLINNAAVFSKGLIESISAEKIQSMFFVNCTVPFQLVRSALSENQKPMSIVNIASLGGIQEREKFPGFSVYSMTKSALCTMTQCMAVEFKKNNSGNRINCVAPGALHTPMLAKAMGGDNPGGANPVNAADIVLFLLSENSTIMNGEIITLSTN